MADPIGALRAEISASTAKFQRDLGRLRGDIKKFSKQSHRDMMGFKSGFDAATRSILSMAAAYISFRQVMRVGREIIDAASAVEKYEFRLTALLQSQEKATQKLKEYRDLAATVPHSLEDIIEAGVTLEAFGANSSKWLSPISDLAFVMGTTLPESARALGMAYASGAGAADIFRNKGILDIIKASQGIEDVTKLTLPDFRNAMLEAFTDPQGKIAGSAKKAAGTWEGILSMLGDKWFNFKTDIADAGVFEFLKMGFSEVDQEMAKLAESGDLKIFAENISNFAIVGLKGFALALAGVIDLGRAFRKTYLLAKQGFLEFVIGVEEVRATVKGWIPFLQDQVRASQEQVIKLTEDLVATKVALIDMVEAGDVSPKILLAFEKIEQSLDKLRENAKKPIDVGGTGDDDGGDKDSVLKQRENQKRLNDILFESYSQQEKARRESQEKIGAMIQAQAQLEWNIQQENVAKQKEIQDNLNKMWEEFYANQAAMRDAERAGWMNTMNQLVSVSGQAEAIFGGQMARITKTLQVFAATQALINALLGASQALGSVSVSPWEKIILSLDILGHGLSLVASIKSLSNVTSGGGVGGVGGVGSRALVDGRTLSETTQPAPSYTVINYIDGVISPDKLEETMRKSIGPAFGEYVKDNGGTAGPITFEFRRK